jgi:hypothetical protein
MDQLLLQRLELAFLAAVAELQDRSRVIQAPIDVVLSEATALQPDLVLVLDQAKTVEIHRRDPGAGRYRLVATCRPGDQAATPLVPALAVAVTDLFSA